MPEAVDQSLGRLLAKGTEPESLRRRFGVVTAIGGTTVDVDLAGTTLPDVAVLTSYAPNIDDVVVVDFNGSDPLVLGSVGGNMAWLDYTPAWTSNGVAPALGDGILTGRYVRLGRTIHGTIYFQVGSTSTMGTGDYFWSLPVAQYTGQFTFQAIGMGKGFDASTANNITAIATFEPSTQSLRLMYSATAPAGLETHVGQLTPWTWAVSDDLTIFFTYEAAA